ncbi:Ig-like domain-containing protein, partial [Pediococcus acidilactici]|uniref:Ig-like domain-containing protein n=1 Tax=Pediococcus acidilactici TaxID=1254 RepID=UPI0019502F25
TEGDRVITGTGTPGATVNVSFADGSPIGVGVKVDANGNWTVDASHVTLKAGDQIVATQTVNGVTSDQGTQTVKAKEEVSAPVISDITEGDSVITGTGTPGATVNVSFADGTPIGVSVKVDANGNWTVDASHVTLKAGDQIVATQTVNGVTSDQGTQTVKPKQGTEVPQPSVDPVKASAKTITGQGKEGYTIKAYRVNDDGTKTEIGSIEVDTFGQWIISVPDNIVLKSGDKIEVIQIAPDGSESTPKDVIVE